MLAPFLILIQVPGLFAPPGTVRDERNLAPGVTFFQERIPVGSPDGPMLVNVVRIAPNAPSVRVAAALGQDRVWGTDPTAGREIVSSLAARRGALAAVNAGFFPFLGNPIGLHVEDGELVTEPTLERSSFVLTQDGRATVRAFKWAGKIEAGGESQPLSGLNRKPGKGSELLLFTPKFFGRTLKIPERFEVVLTGAPPVLRPGATFTGTVLGVYEGGDAPLEQGTVVISAGGARVDWLRSKANVGDRITVNLDVSVARGEPLDPSTIRHAVTGAGRLLVRGQVDLQLDAEHLKGDFSTTRHPRTAAGVTADGGILLVTVDGRQPTIGRGTSLTELALLLRRLGAVDALNLDGGGSTAMAILGGIVNSPSDGKERPVADMLVVLGPAPSLPATFSLAGPSKPLAVGEAYYFLPQGEAIWSADGGAGFVDQRGVFFALRPGKATVRVLAHGQAAKVEITVAPLLNAPPGVKQ